MQKIKDDYAEAGDLGNVAAAARAKQKTMFKPKPLTVQGVFKCAQLLVDQSVVELYVILLEAVQKLGRCQQDSISARRAFQAIARTQGTKSQDRKIDLINKLLVSSTDVEPGFIMRALQVWLPMH